MNATIEFAHSDETHAAAVPPRRRRWKSRVRGWLQRLRRLGRVIAIPELGPATCLVLAIVLGAGSIAMRHAANDGDDLAAEPAQISSREAIYIATHALATQAPRLP